MKRDMELVRSIMLLIETEGSPALSDVPEMDGSTNVEVLYHLRLLLEASYIEAIDASDLSGPDYMEISLTWGGHEFLETIRDSEVWTKTKAGASRVGSWSVSLLADLGKAYALDKARHLGLPV